jgi:Bacteriophage lambda head decoration protein D
MGNPLVTPISESWHAGGFMVSKANGHRSIDDGTFASGSKYLPGTVLGQQTLGGATAAAKSGGNTGNGTCTGVSAQVHAVFGVYKAICEIAGTNSATWSLYAPDGEMIDQKEYSTSGGTAVFANDQIHATITDGATDSVVGDEFDITVAPGTGDYVNYNPTNTDGSQTVAAICYGYVDATNAAANGAIVTRACEVNASELVWDASVSNPTLVAAGVAGLKALGIIAR